MPHPTIALTLAAGLLIAAGTWAAEATPAATGEPAAATAPYNVIGREDAPVSIIEFSDLQCAYCARYALETFPLLRERYIATGKVRYAAADLPLPMHQHAVAAAVAARCAGEQGAFWRYRAALFAAQAVLGAATFDEIAADEGLDVGRLSACRKDDRHVRGVRADQRLAAQQGIEQTPSFVIGRMVDGEFRAEVLPGAMPYEVFAARIEALLAEAAR